MKKFMRRSIALSALIALSLSGTAMAADYTASEFEAVAQDGKVVVAGDVVINYVDANEKFGKVYGSGICDQDLTVFKIDYTGVNHVEADNITITSDIKGIFAGTKDMYIKTGDLTITSKDHGIFVVKDGPGYGSIVVDADKVNVTSTGGYAVMGNGQGTTEINAKDIVLTSASGVSNNASGKMTINAENVTIKSDLYGLAATGGTGGIEVNAKEDLVIETTTTNPNKGALQSQHGDISVSAGGTMTIKGDIIAGLNWKGEADTDSKGGITATLNGAESSFTGRVTTKGEGATTLNMSDGAVWNVTGESNLTELNGNDAVIAFQEDAEVTIDTVSGTNTEIAVTEDTIGIGSVSVGAVAEGASIAVNGDSALTDSLAAMTKDKQTEKLGKMAAMLNVENGTGYVTTDESIVAGSFYAEVVNGEIKEDTVKETVNQYNAGLADMASLALINWRAETDDMNKRLGELRDANGQHGIWARMTRGESEFGAAKNV